MSGSARRRPIARSKEQTARPYEALADRLAPGNAIAAVIVQHVWADALEDAVARIGGSGVANEFVDTSHVSDLADRLLTAAEETG